MQERISIVSIIVEDLEAAPEINELLHRFGEYVIGRMGIPYKEKGISIICVILEAPADVVSTLSGKIGMIKDVSIKTVTSKNR